MENNLQGTKELLIEALKEKMENGILEQSSVELLEKLINNADTIKEAQAIAGMGMIYKRTGYHFDHRDEIDGDNIKYFVKNEELSFVTDEDSKTHKLIIGDNYDVLPNLLISHKGAIDIIYIDPPYAADSMGTYAETNYNNAITRDNLLSMMEPRLQLAKQLLSKEGVIFCSIDDRNQAHLKCLFDEVFGERNFIDAFVWEKNPNPTYLNRYSRSSCEYVLCYAKNLKYLDCLNDNTITSDETDAPLQNKGNPKRVINVKAGVAEFRFEDTTMKKGTYGLVELLDDVTISDGKNVNDFRIEGTFRMTEETMYEKIAEGEQLIFKSKKMAPRLTYTAGNSTYAPNKLLKASDYGTNQVGNNDFERVCDKGGFEYPKPVQLIKKLISFVMNEDAVVLDFFAGSGTTGQAVLELNREDGGNRQFILCTNNEITDVNPNGIAYDVTSKRIKRVMTGVCYDGTNDFKWLKENEPYGDNLDVLEIALVANFTQEKGATPFDVIDETLYGLDTFEDVEEKVAWVCRNFDNTQKCLESDEDWKKRTQKGE